MRASAKKAKAEKKAGQIRLRLVVPQGAVGTGQRPPALRAPSCHKAKIHKGTCAGQGGRNRAGLGRTGVQEMQAGAKNHWEGDEWGHGEEYQGVRGGTWVVCTSSAHRVVYARA